MATKTATANVKKNWIAALLLSVLVGSFGVDRFYLGKVGTGILKLVTFGGFGVWWLIDIIMIATRTIKDVEWED
jgi:TM2 domain-containing membrane protein YozV